MAEEDNLAQQFDEIEALSAIYGDEFKLENETQRMFSIRIKEGADLVILEVTFPEQYPSLCPPHYSLTADSLSGSQRQRLSNELDAVYLAHVGQCVVYEWVEAVRAVLVAAQSEALAAAA